MAGYPVYAIWPTRDQASEGYTLFAKILIDAEVAPVCRALVTARAAQAF